VDLLVVKKSYNIAETVVFTFYPYYLVFLAESLHLEEELFQEHIVFIHLKIFDPVFFKMEADYLQNLNQSQKEVIRYSLHHLYRIVVKYKGYLEMDL
jgi:hypothetical protein